MEAKLADFGLSALVCKKKGEIMRMSSSEAENVVHGHPDNKALQDEWTVRAKSKVGARQSSMSLKKSASIKQFDLSGATGSYMYMAPEVFREEPYSEKVGQSIKY